MAKVNDAYSVLSSDQSRKEYDQSLRTKFNDYSAGAFGDQSSSFQTNFYEPENRYHHQNVWNEYFHHYNHDRGRDYGRLAMVRVRKIRETAILGKIMIRMT